MSREPKFFRCLLSIFIIGCLSTLILAAPDFPEEVIQAKSSIKGSMLLSYIDFLSSPYCRGRETGKPGMATVMKYITTVLAGHRVEGAGSFGSYNQPTAFKAVSLDNHVRLMVEETDRSGRVKQVKSARLNWDFLPVMLSAELQVTAPVVFAGYGITATEHKYDDYKNLDAHGKIVLVMRHAPNESGEKNPPDGPPFLRHRTLLSKILNAQEHGAKGIIFVTDPLNHENQAIKGGSYMSGTLWPGLLKQKMKTDEDFKYMTFTPRLRIVGDDFGVKIPAVVIDGKLADYILGETHSLIEIQKKIDNTMTPQSFSLPRKEVTMDIFFKNEPVEGGNIVAKVEGSDPVLKDEVVIVGAHYDHMGKDNRGQFFPGADDNASGTAAVLEIARAFTGLKQKPKRTILFIFFTAEEKGLMGSRYYIRHPLFPLEKTLAMINLDMLGRNNVDQLSVIGKYHYPKLFNITDAINKETAHFELNFNVEELILSSDHFPFMRAGIPSLFFISGYHDQLHTPKDTVDRIRPDKVEKAAQLVFLTLWKVADLPAGKQLK
jgi:hypothetical protein